MNYSQEQIDAFVLEARDRERARCAAIADEAALDAHDDPDPPEKWCRLIAEKIRG